MNLKKSERTFIFILVLIIVSGLSAGLISVVYGVTKPRIEMMKKQAIIDAAKIVLPPSDRIEQKEKDSIKYFEGTKVGKTIGYAFTTEDSNGYSGRIQILMGIDTSCNISGFQIMQHSETPGLGDQASKSFFKEQFKGKGVKNFNFLVKKDGGDVDAITAATITSRAVTAALKDGLDKFSDIAGCR